MTRHARFWIAPKELVTMLARRELTVTEYTLLHVLAESDADRDDGFTTTTKHLAGVLGISDKTTRRALISLRDQGLIDYPDHERVALFTIRTTETLRSLVRSPGTAAVTAATADTPVPATGRKPASAEALPAVTTSVPRARARVEVDRDEVPGSPRTASRSRGRLPDDFFSGPTPLELECILAPLELERILACCVDADEGSFSILAREAKGLPEASLVKVRQSCERFNHSRGGRGRLSVGYAVNALRSEREERRA